VKKIFGFSLRHYLFFQTALLFSSKLAIPSRESEHLENAVFVDTFSWFPITFIIWFFILLAIYVLWLKKPSLPPQ